MPSSPSHRSLLALSSIYLALFHHVCAFSVEPLLFCPRVQQRSALTVCAAGRGMGMGMGAATKQKKKKNGMKVKVNAKNGAGSANGSASFDVSASLLKLEKAYDKLLLAEAKRQQRENEEYKEEEDIWAPSKPESEIADDVRETVLSEFVVAVREKPSSSLQRTAMSDWIPVAQICLERPVDDGHTFEGSSDVLVQSVVSKYCRELFHAATMGAPVVQRVPRNDLQYSAEPVDSFFKHVFESVVEKSKDNANDMTKSQAREVLSLEADSTYDKAAIKQAYRRLSFQLHPDRFEGTDEECKDAAVQFSRVQLAYDTLSSGIRGSMSWYESLGGRARTEFVGPIELLSIAKATSDLDEKVMKSAVVGLDPELVQSFVARNLRST